NGVDLTKGGLLFISFQGNLAHVNVPNVTANAGALTGANAAATVSQVSVNIAAQSQGAGNETLNITTTTVASANGTFNLGGQSSTFPLTAGPTGRAAIQAALEALPNVGPGNVIVLGPNVAASGSIYTVIFVGALASANIPTLTVFATAGAIAIGAA